MAIAVPKIDTDTGRDLLDWFKCVHFETVW